MHTDMVMNPFFSKKRVCCQLKEDYSTKTINQKIKHVLRLRATECFHHVTQRELSYIRFGGSDNKKPHPAPMPTEKQALTNIEKPVMNLLPESKPEDKLADDFFYANFLPKKKSIRKLRFIDKLQQSMPCPVTVEPLKKQNDCQSFSTPHLLSPRIQVSSVDDSFDGMEMPVSSPVTKMKKHGLLKLPTMKKDLLKGKNLAKTHRYSLKTELDRLLSTD